tara:strand:- start:5405 stop:6253 length:849 start_codon:yes stop_codon:yes gene_type:complete
MYTKSNKEIYRFKVFLEQETDVDVDVEKEVEVEKKVEVEKTRKGKDGKTEKYTDTELKKVKEKQIVIESRKSVEKVEQIFVIKQPTRRQMEEADMEYSIEMSKCVKKGVLTKAMLMNKYTDTGGMLSEKDAQELSKLYGKLGELQTDFTALNLKSQSKASESKKSEVSKDMAELRRTIATAETNFSALLNHTADTRAQNKVIVWYLLTLTNLEKDGKLESFFTGETFEEKKDHFYKMEEEEDELLEVVYDKITAFISFWYFSSSASESDFKDLEKDIEEGSL